MKFKKLGDMYMLYDREFIRGSVGPEASQFSAYVTKTGEKQFFETVKEAKNWLQSVV